MRETEAAESLSGALASIGIAAMVVPPDSARGSAMLDVEGKSFCVEFRSIVTAAHGEWLVSSPPDGVPPRVLVADRIAQGARAAMRQAGLSFYDQRGTLRLIDPPLVIDAQVPAVRSLGPPTMPLSGQVAKEVAIICLTEPGRPHGVRDVARTIDRAPSAVSKAMAGLRNEGLLTSAGEPMVPDLFRELAAVWRRRAFPLAALPSADKWEAQRLRLGLDDPEGTDGWALTDTRAAQSWGMPIIARGDYPPDFYVPTASVLRAARIQLGAPNGDRACTVALAPARFVCRHRFDHSHTSGETWPVAGHIVTALDLAQDRARGVEALGQWDPAGIARVW